MRWLGVGNLLGNALLSKQSVFLFPGLVHGTFSISISRGAVLKLDGESGTEVAWLQPLSLNPYIFDARYFCRHVLYTFQRSLLVRIRDARLPFKDDHMDDRFWLTKFILSRQVTAREQRKRKQTASQNSSHLRNTNSHV